MGITGHISILIVIVCVSGNRNRKLCCSFLFFGIECKNEKREDSICTD